MQLKNGKPDNSSAASPSKEDVVFDDNRLYFTRPAQLLELFGELEAHNLSLITNGQETEEALQELDERIRAEREECERERAFQQMQLEAAENEIKRETRNAWLAKERASYFSVTSLDKQEEEMAFLGEKVTQVYTACIGENEANISTLQMLTNIENKLEELFEKIAKMPADKVEEAERAKEKQRRLRLREEKLEAQRKHQEERVRMALERAQAAPKKMTGKRLVFRSAPPKARKGDQSRKKQQSEEEEEMKYYFSEI